MKKNKLYMGLTSGLLGILALSACASVTPKEEAIVTFKDNKGNTQTIVTNLIYNRYRNSSDGVLRFYNQILEEITRYEFDSATTKVWKKTNAQIKTEAENNLTSAKNTALENAKTAGTSYGTEWEKILKEKGCEDEKDLLEYYIYHIEKDELEDKFFSDKRGELTSEYIGVDKTGASTSKTDITSCYPYHIRHILVKTSASATSYYNGAITADEAKNLSTAISYLTDTNYDFAYAAEQISEDGSASEGGDAGIMTTSTSFVNEFKLGIYAYDLISNFYGNGENEVISNGVGLNDTYKISTSKGFVTAKSYFLSHGIQEVPFGAFKMMGEMAEYDKDEEGKEVNKGNEQYFPRNILFNNYMNLHEPFVITNQELDPLTGEPMALAADSGRFVNGVLCDEANRVIVGVRSEYGIHFMIMQSSIYDFAKGGEGVKEASLNEYYTTYTPADDEPGQYPYFEGQPKNTYVNFIKASEESQYVTRANKVKDAIKGFDTSYDFRLYEKYVADGKIKFNNTDGYDLGVSINKYIDATRKTTKSNSEKTMNEKWRDYVELIDVEQANRIPFVLSGVGQDALVDEVGRLIPVRCAVGFRKHAGAAWTNAKGACHYED